jgi:hypothetical protein
VGLKVHTFGAAHPFLKQFLSEARPNGPSCLVLDVRLPELSGLDLQGKLAAGSRGRRSAGARIGPRKKALEARLQADVDFLVQHNADLETQTQS